VDWRGGGFGEGRDHLYRLRASSEMRSDEANAQHRTPNVEVRKSEIAVIQAYSRPKLG